MENKVCLLLVLTTFPEAEKAREASRYLLDKKLAACCTLFEGSSIYWWENRLNEDKETVMMIKTRPELYPELERRLKEIHPYQVPEIIALPVIAVSQSYLDWVKEATEV
jgi:periplasmic divalent cation tolerance protein